MITEDTEKRYRHGKLIEWSVGGARYALTGSPNLSSSALLHSVHEGGNCELGMIAPVTSSLLPEGEETAPGQIRALPVGQRRDSRSALLLLGATRVDGPRLHIQLVRPLSGTNGQVELSPATAPPESWERVGDVGVGVHEKVVQVAAEGGSRIRVTQMGADGILRHSNTVYVLDFRRASQRFSSPAASQTPRIQPADLFQDTRLAERFFADMANLAAGGSPPPAVATARQPRNTSTTRVDEQRDGWQHYLDLCAGRLGHPLLRFALGQASKPDDQDDAGPESEAPAPVNWMTTSCPNGKPV
ncbi:MAG: hypothetical protein H0V10_02970 [Geodermatophilaceae bacterium]|nr:hypothetical protein [Geodermatophilaceae bacterium]